MRYVLPRQAPSKNAPFGAFFISTRQLTLLHVFAGHASSWGVVYEAGLDSKAQKLPTHVVCRTDPEGTFFYLGMAGRSVSW